MRRFQPAVLALMLGAACAPARTASVSGSASLAIADDGIGRADPAVADDHTPAGDAPAGEAPAPGAEAAPPEPAVEPVAYVASAAEPAPAPAAEPAPPPVVEAAPRRPLDPPPPPVADPPAPDPAPEVEPAPAPPLPPRRAAAPRPKEHHATPAPGGPAGFNGERISLDFKDADIQNVLR